MFLCSNAYSIPINFTSKSNKTKQDCYVRDNSLTICWITHLTLKIICFKIEELKILEIIRNQSLIHAGSILKFMLYNIKMIKIHPCLRERSLSNIYERAGCRLDIVKRLALKFTSPRSQTPPPPLTPPPLPPPVLKINPPPKPFY